MRKHGDVVRAAPALPCAGKPRGQVGDAQPQPFAKLFLKVRRCPLDQPGTVPTADGQRIPLRQECLDRIVSDLAQVEALQQVRRRARQGRMRAIGGQGSPGLAVAKRPPRASFSTVCDLADIERINRPRPAETKTCASVRPFRQAPAVPKIYHQIRLALAGEPFAEFQLLRALGNLEMVGTRG